MLKKLIPRKSASRWMGAETELELEKHFHVEKKLGKGSYAIVYRVERLADGQRYALKVADVAALGPADQMDCVNEIRLLASLAHPNLTTFYEAFVDGGKLCIVQELVGGGDIAGLIARRAANFMHFSEGQVWATLLQVSLGLQHLHHRRVLHRDLKPQNILISEGGCVKLADLGISAVLDRVFERTMIGTPHYMAPEMWRRQPYSYSADIWALGCIVHELCTLRPLFLGSNDTETARKVLAGEVPPLPARYSAELRALVAAMLAQHPAARPTVDDILQSPAAQLHLALLPQELRAAYVPPAQASGERGQGAGMRLRQPIAPPRSPEEWQALNAVLPTPRYPRRVTVPGGSGVFAGLHGKGKTKSWSTGDLQALAAIAEDEERGASFSGGGGAPPGTAAAAVAQMRQVQSYGSLSAAVDAELQQRSSQLTRRKSLSVGEPLEGPGDGSGGSPSGGAHGRCRPSLATGLGTVPEEAAASGRGHGGRHGSSPSAAGLLAAAEDGVEGRAVWRGGRDVRSKSLSVEDALETVASGRLQLPSRPGKPQQAAAAAPAAPSAASAASRPGPALAAPLVSASPGALAVVQQPGSPLAAPAATAQVQVQAAAPGGAKPLAAAASPPPPMQQQQHQQQQPDSDGKKKKSKRGLFGRHKDKG